MPSVGGVFRAEQESRWQFTDKAREAVAQFNERLRRVRTKTPYTLAAARQRWRDRLRLVRMR